jgi:enoyl-CoA hydratase
MKESAISYSRISLRFEDLGDGKTAAICLESPATGNCIDETMAEEIRDACRRINEADECRLATIKGSGERFSSGRTAVNGVVAGGQDSPAERMRRLRVADTVADLPMPVLVVLNGDAIGHGLELALAGDLRICSEDAHLALWKTGQSAVLWDGGTQRLPRLVGPAWALDLAITGREMTAAEALGIGLVNRVVPAAGLAKAARALAEQMLAAAPIAARYTKEAVGKGMDLSLEQGLRLEADLSVLLHSTEDRAEGITSFQERRQPKFTGV